MANATPNPATIPDEPPTQDEPSEVAPIDGSLPAPKWETINVGLGDQWDFKKGPMIGYYLGSELRAIPDLESPSKTRDTNAYRFASYNNPDEIVFIWGSATIDDAMGHEENYPRIGQLVRIAFLGEESFTDKATGKPRRIKRYNIQRDANFRPAGVE